MANPGMTIDQRLDAIYPRISKALAWGARYRDIADYHADTEETRAAEALFNARLLDYAQGGEEGVKLAVKRLVEAHAKRASDKP
jgi:hypothetical protein